MNTRALCATVAIAVVTLISTAHADTLNVPAKPYRYGMPMDVKRVIALEEPHPADCEVVRAKLTYLDHAGVVRAVTYVKMSDACEVLN